jgi:hypothetical protein
MLKRYALLATRQHEAKVSASLQLVRVNRFLDTTLEFTSRNPRIEIDGRRPLEETIEMFIQEGRPPVEDADALPDSVAQNEASVEHRHEGPFAWNELAVEMNQESRVGFVLVAMWVEGHLVSVVGGNAADVEDRA